MSATSEIPATLAKFVRLWQSRHQDLPVPMVEASPLASFSVAFVGSDVVVIQPMEAKRLSDVVWKLSKRGRAVLILPEIDSDMVEAVDRAARLVKRDLPY